MPTDWNLPDVAQSYEDYEPIRERALAYPLMFEALGLGSPNCRTVLDYGCGTGKVAERIVSTFEGVSMIAADPSSGMLGIARSKRTHPKIRYQQIGQDQGLDLGSDSIDGALSCFIFVCISEAERIRRIVQEVYRVLRPGATYAMLELDPASIGVPFSIVQMGEKGRTYGAGDPVEVRLTVPGAEPLVVVDYYWPKDVHVGFLEDAGFGQIRAHTPTLPQGYDGPGAERMEVERTYPPYVIYTAQK
ncbi:class I SAM-dependent methyltransferase [Pendulispora brunnea]|uniref:Class I SAM-dependent methyltransferase n=1 Tax=Pendulispora brunnea TaxID=2905690 RepID=A0ABZ2JWH7_9BACT